MVNEYGVEMFLGRLFSAARGYNTRGKLHPDINGDSECLVLPRQRTQRTRYHPATELLGTDRDKLGPWGRRGKWGKRARGTSGTLSDILQYEVIRSTS